MTLVGVVGAGVMGVGVAQNLAQTGHDVILVDKDEETLREALTLIERNCRMSRLMGGPEVDAAEVLARITTGVGAKQVASAEIVIENVTENWDVKRAVHGRWTRACGPETVFVANTSAIPITKMASVTDRPDRVVGVHFMNPVPAKPVVELIPRLPHQRPRPCERTRDLLTAMGKRRCR